MLAGTFSEIQVGRVTQSIFAENSTENKIVPENKLNKLTSQILPNPANPRQSEEAYKIAQS